ncbi:MAG: hypothetical protein ACKOHM_08800 [Spartobacteria bacterium]
MKLVLLSALMLLSKVTLHAADFNAIVLEQIRKMPEGGGYATTREAHQALNSAVAVSPLGLRVESSKAQPSYCSGATYLLFLKTLAAAEKQGFCPPGTSSSEDLLPKAMPDGVGIWGRWNANGPGTARLFHELGLGKNFTSWEDARPGDFLKIFWSTDVGKKERGHLVVYLGMETKDGVEHVRFWSSNKPGGYGEKSVPKSKVAAAIFSRLENPSNIQRAAAMPKKDDYLAGLLTRESSLGEALRNSGVATH